MKKIEIKNYEIEVTGKNERSEIETKKMPYNVRDSLIGVLLNPEINKKLNIGGREALQINKLADKIEECKDDFILLEAGEYEKITRACDAFTGWGRFDGKFLSRVFDAETVEVTEKK